MESETSVDVRIFFKDKKNELKGPYTEREVQDWYRQNWFDSSFPFYFMKGNERPTEQTEFLTLDTLRTLNGVGCPFAPVKPESNSENIDEKIAKLEKELVDLSKKCDGVKELEKRLEDVEKRLKELSTQQPPASSSSDAAAAPVATKAAPAATATKKPAKQPEENSEHAGMANLWAAYYLEILEAYKTNKWDKVVSALQSGESKVLALLYALGAEAGPLHQKCRDVLLKKLMELDYVYCSECDSIFHNFKQIMLHMTVPQHNNESDEIHEIQRTVNGIMMDLFSPLLISLQKAEEDYIVNVLGKYKHINRASSPELHPLMGFIFHITSEYAAPLVKGALNLEFNRTQIVAKLISQLKNDDMGRKLMNELHEHIGDAQTGCYECDVATGTRDEFYKHHRTFAHINKASGMDLITLVINMFKKD